MISVKKKMKIIKITSLWDEGPKEIMGVGVGGIQSIFLPLLREMSGFCAGVGRERTNMPFLKRKLCRKLNKTK